MSFAVIMPAHNAEGTIGAALDSIAAQRHQPAEVLIAADNCSDRTLSIARGYDLPITAIEVNYRNAAAARNHIVNLCSSPWLAFLDADDVWYPDHLKRASEWTANTGDVGYFSLVDYLYLEGPRTEPGKPRWPIDVPTSGLTHRDYMGFWNHQLFFQMITTVVRRDRFLDVGGYDPEQRRRHDFDMWLRVIHGHTWTYNPDVTARYTIDTPGSISRENWANSEWFMLRAMLKNRAAYADCGLLPIIASTARRAMASAYTDGSAEDRKRAHDLAWEHLSGRDRLVFRAASAAPRIFQHINRKRRERISASSE